MATRRPIFAPTYGSAPFHEGKPTVPPMPRPDGKPPMRLPITGLTPPGNPQGGDASAAPPMPPGAGGSPFGGAPAGGAPHQASLDDDAYTQLVRLLQVNGVL